MISLMFVLFSSLRQDNSLTSDRVWSLADAIPGTPDTDYPILGDIPETDFSCDNRLQGEIYVFFVRRCPNKWIKILLKMSNSDKWKNMINLSASFGISF